MKILLCHCEQCVHGRSGHKSHGSREIRTKLKGWRSRIKARLKNGEYNDLPEKFSGGYTD